MYNYGKKCKQSTARGLMLFLAGVVAETSRITCRDKSRVVSRTCVEPELSHRKVHALPEIRSRYDSVPV